MGERLALFDLDHTLLAGDSDHAWGEFLIGKRLVDRTAHRAENDHHYAAYRAGKLNIQEYVAFALGPVKDMSMPKRQALHAAFMRDSIIPIILPKARALVRQHQEQEDCCIIITATNNFIAAPIAEQFRIKHLLATELEETNGQFTGNIQGIPCFREGKVTRIKQWLSQQKKPYRLDQAVFYTDSINDLPLLRSVGYPVAIDPDPELKKEAKLRGWPIKSLR